MRDGWPRVRLLNTHSAHTHTRTETQYLYHKLCVQKLIHNRGAQKKIVLCQNDPIFSNNIVLKVRNSIKMASFLFHVFSNFD